MTSLRTLSKTAAVAAALALILGAGTIQPGQAQTAKEAPHALPTELRNKCVMCHTCTTPTKSDPCLVVCPRVKESTAVHSPAEGPGLVLMDSKDGQYGPVVFSHRTHAQMTEMSGGCYGCHHYKDTAQRILTCRSCHPADRKRENVGIPDLKGAYHRQCMDCHRQWTGAPNCSSCHLGKTDGKTDEQILNSYARGRKDHPPVQPPAKKEYATRGQDSTVVPFYHTDHAGRFGIACTDCHRQEGCISCHDKRPEKVRAQAASARKADFEATHARCSSCHADQTCQTCHVKADPGPFEHARTSGWALKSYHASLACSRCHAGGRVFTGLRSECGACHKAWDGATFNHAVTGLKLDETHGALECADCHAGKDFLKAPACTGCHPDKSYPQSKPGKLLAK
jgi:hypothetical protein